MASAIGMPLNDLKDGKVRFMSFCKRGMNQHARIALYKSADAVEKGGGWDESKHPRHEAGTEEGGRFAAKQAGYKAAEAVRARGGSKAAQDKARGEAYLKELYAQRNPGKPVPRAAYEDQDDEGDPHDHRPSSGHPDDELVSLGYGWDGGVAPGKEKPGYRIPKPPRSTRKSFDYSTAAPLADTFSPSGHSRTGDNHMPTAEELRISTLEKALASALVIAKMSDAEKAHCEGMNDADKAAFMALGKSGREAILTKARADREASDESFEFGGQTIRKSIVGPDVFMVMKSQAAELAATRERVSKAELAGEMATLRKTADDKYGKLPGTTDEKADALYAIGKIADEKVRTTLEKMLTAGQTAIEKAFGRAGFSAGDPTPESAEAELQKMADEHVKLHKCSVEEAYDAVCKTAKGRELYSRSLTERPTVQ